ncbi:proteasome activator complex subunit 1 [Rhinatrema bivittatum]|uniref:proteasome activator complex subunit 1 n=1 Tax=Rhinatrema bivittatum TaxID=194408 RepID=UPI00112D2093|nr:proteasome activator complex subunit 1 [Rhinatrema bivittatum]
MAALPVRAEAKEKVDKFRKELCAEAESLVGSHFPQKILELDGFLKEKELNLPDPSVLRAELDIPIPDPEKEKEKERKKKEEKEKEGKKKDEEEENAPPCGPVSCNERIVALLNRVKPEIREVKEKLNLVSMWVQLQVPKIEDGNNFGVAVQEKVFELMTNMRTKLEGFQTQISKYFSERGDAVAKAAKQPHVGDYRQLVHELDEAEYAEIRAMVAEIQNAYAILYDVVMKNSDKIKKPRSETKALIY